MKKERAGAYLHLLTHLHQFVHFKCVYQLESVLIRKNYNPQHYNSMRIIAKTKEFDMQRRNRREIEICFHRVFCASLFYSHFSLYLFFFCPVKLFNGGVLVYTNAMYVFTKGWALELYTLNVYAQIKCRKRN